MDNNVKVVVIVFLVLGLIAFPASQALTPESALYPSYFEDPGDGDSGEFTIDT